MFYEFRQNNSGGSFTYDELSGVSVTVLIEADSPQEANIRAESIGIYFDGYGDCSCCGNRWHEVDSYDEYTEDIPKPDAVFIRDDTDRLFTTKWIDGYEGFVHLADGSFYGYGKDVKIINKRRYGGKNGYGLIFSSHYVDIIRNVDGEGWDKSGNRNYPHPNYPNFKRFNLIFDEDYIKVSYDKVDATYVIWSLDKKLLLSIKEIAEENLNQIRQLFDENKQRILDIL